MKTSVLLSTFVLLSSLSAFSALQGYRGEPPRIPLTAADMQNLAQFKPVYPPIVDQGNGGGGQAVFRVKAPANVVWAVISDFPNYTRYNPDLSEASYYRPKMGDNMFVKFIAGPFIYRVTWHVKHNYPMGRLGWGTWELDKSENNDLTECIGFWRVDPVPGTNHSDVSYSVNLEGSGVILNWLRPMLIKTGVQKATQWVKDEAQRRVGTN